MEAIGIKSYNTYIKTFNELVEFGFFNLIERSKNQYSANIIELSKFDKALNKALDKAFIKHATKQSESTQQSNNSINKPITNKQINKKQFDVENENVFHDITVLQNHYLDNERLLKAVLSGKNNKVKSIDDIKLKLDLFCKNLIEQGRFSETWKEFTRYFLNSLKSGKFNDFNTPNKVVINPNNEELIKYNSNVNPTVFELPKSKFLEMQEKNKEGGYIYKILN